MPPWEKTGVPGDVDLTHFHSSRISGSASCMISRTFASVFPRQSPGSLIFSSMNAEADATGTGLFMYSSNSRTYFSCAQRNLQPPQVAGNCPITLCPRGLRQPMAHELEKGGADEGGAGDGHHPGEDDA